MPGSGHDTRRVRRAGRVLRAALVAMCAAASLAAIAQPLASTAERDDARANAAYDRAAAEAGAALVSASTPEAHWIAGVLERADPAARVRHFAAAHAMAPSRMLHLAALAMECTTVRVSGVPECDQIDRLAEWAARDADNGFPHFLLALRAAQRKQPDKVAGHLADAAAKPRLDDYWSEAQLAAWTFFQGFAVPSDPVLKARVAQGAGVLHPLPSFAGPCTAADGPPAALREACAAAGQAMADRGRTFIVQELGLSMAGRSAPTPEADAAIASRAAALGALRSQCTSRLSEASAALDADDDRVRSPALAQMRRHAQAVSQMGEVAACRRLLEPVPR